MGFRLMTSSRRFGDSAISGTTRQQSKSLVRTWFIWETQMYIINIGEGRVSGSVSHRGLVMFLVAITKWEIKT